MLQAQQEEVVMLVLLIVLILINHKKSDKNCYDHVLVFTKSFEFSPGAVFNTTLIL